MQPYTNYQNAALFLLRLITAATFFVAAYYKFPFWSGSSHPGVTPFFLFVTKLLSIVEPLGAIALLIGFLTRLASVGLTIILLGAIYVAQFVWGMSFVTSTSVGWNFTLCVLGGTVILIAFGPGAWSIDSRFRKKHS